MTPSRQRWLQFGLAVVLVVIALIFTMNVDNLMRRTSFLPLMIAVIISAWYGGLWPALVSTVLASLLWLWKVAPPENKLLPTDETDLTRVFLFCMVGLITGILHEQRNRAQRNALVLHSRLNLALESSRMAAFDYDVTHKRFWASEGLRMLLGRNGDEFSETFGSFLAYAHPDDREAVVRTMTQTIRGCSVVQAEYRIVRPDHAVRWVQIRGRCISDDAQNLVRLVGVMTDVTDMHAEEAPVLTPLRPLTRVPF